VNEFKVFVGMDKRQPLAYTVCRSSIERHASKRVSVEPLVLEWCPIKKRGLTEFTYTRYLVPWMCGFKGNALFMDADVVVRGDVTEIPDLVDPLAQVAVVKNKLRFEWPSVMYFNCATCIHLTPEYIEANPCNDFAWARRVDELPAEWNHLVGYDEPSSSAKLLHFTAGIPCWNETRDFEHAETWMTEFRHAVSTVSWAELMGNSVHAKLVMDRLRGRNGLEEKRA
jgi:lipopolysaccharide biosynthesis glycosyltransferase